MAAAAAAAAVEEGAAWRALKFGAHFAGRMMWCSMSVLECRPSTNGHWMASVSIYIYDLFKACVSPYIITIGYARLPGIDQSRNASEMLITQVYGSFVGCSMRLPLAARDTMDGFARNIYWLSTHHLWNWYNTLCFDGKLKEPQPGYTCSRHLLLQGPR